MAIFIILYLWIVIDPIIPSFLGLLHVLLLAGNARGQWRFAVIWVVVYIAISAAILLYPAGPRVIPATGGLMVGPEYTMSAAEALRERFLISQAALNLLAVIVLGVRLPGARRRAAFPPVDTP